MCDLLTPHGFSGRNFVRGVICTLKMYIEKFNFSYEFKQREVRSIPVLITKQNQKKFLATKTQR